MTASVEAAERKGRGRAIIFLFMALALIAATWITSDLDSERPVRLAPWLVMVALAALNLTSFASARARAPLAFLLNDETTQAHRKQSLIVGYWVSFAAASFMALIASATPVSAILVSKVVIASALAAALVSFAVQELRAGQ